MEAMREQRRFRAKFLEDEIAILQERLRSLSGSQDGEIEGREQTSSEEVQQKLMDLYRELNILKQQEQ